MGYGVMRADLAAQITRLMTNSNSCTASFTQMAGHRGAQRRSESRWTHVRRSSSGAASLVAGLNNASRASPAACPRARSTCFPNITQDGMEVQEAGRRAAGGGRRGGAFRHCLRRLRRRLSALQRGQLDGEPGAGAGAHRGVDEAESLAAACSGEGASRFIRRAVLRGARSIAHGDCDCKGEAMALKDSATGKMIRDYSIEELKEAANLMRGYDLVALCAAGFGPRRRHALDHGHHRRAVPACRRPRSQESQLAGPRPHRLVRRPQGAQPLSRAGLSRASAPWTTW